MNPLQQFDALVPVFKKAARSTSVESFDRQTTCEKWVVRDLFGHMFGGATMFAGAVRGEQTTPPAPPADPELIGATLSAVDDIVAAFGEDGALQRTVQTPFGPMDGESFARLLAVDLLMHTWDLCRSTDQTLAVPDDVVADVDTFARAAIAPEIRGPETFGPEVTPAADAPLIDKLAAFTGRTP